jgi:NADPH:quinone reductase-like Zn-dependent oxidoreductase
MKAMVVEDFKKVPTWVDFANPIGSQTESVIHVSAAALTNLTKAQVNGTHYSSVAAFPFVAGAEGVGRLPNGKRVYFCNPSKPFGALAEQTLVRHNLCVPLPDDLDDATAAALANPAMSSWAALIYRAKIAKGETVLINGATGISGQLAIPIARHLGADKIIVTGRNPEILEKLKANGADEVISLTQSSDKLVRVLKAAFAEHKVSIVLDYLWGESAEAILAAISSNGAKHLEHNIRYVQIGSISGTSVKFPAAVLRSVPIELMGSGIGSVALSDLLKSIEGALNVAKPLGLSIDMECVPMSLAPTIWERNDSKSRVVFTNVSA